MEQNGDKTADLLRKFIGAPRCDGNMLTPRHGSKGKVENLNALLRSEGGKQQP
jgi:hypothetical protein